MNHITRIDHSMQADKSEENQSLTRYRGHLTVIKGVFCVICEDLMAIKEDTLHLCVDHLLGQRDQVVVFLFLRLVCSFHAFFTLLRKLEDEKLWSRLLKKHWMPRASHICLPVNSDSLYSTPKMRMLIGSVKSRSHKSSSVL